MSDANRATVTSEPRSSVPDHASPVRDRRFPETRRERRSPGSPASSSDTERRAPMNWPTSMTLVASTGTAFGDIGNAVILEGRPPDSYRHRSRATVFSLGLKGSATIEWTRGGHLSRFVGTPGQFTVMPPGEYDLIRMDRSIQMLNVVFDMDHIRDLADREWELYGTTIKILPAYQQNKPDVVALGQAFAHVAFAAHRKRALCQDPLDPDRNSDSLVLLVAATPERGVGGTATRRASGA